MQKNTANCRLRAVPPGVDLSTDYGEKHDVAAEHPDVVQELDAAYDQWWASVQPQLVNEKAVGPKENPFKELYWKQFGR